MPSEERTSPLHPVLLYTVPAKRLTQAQPANPGLPSGITACTVAARANSNSSIMRLIIASNYEQPRARHALGRLRTNHVENISLHSVYDTTKCKP
jgi:hypothetical protein